MASRTATGQVTGGSRLLDGVLLLGVLGLAWQLVFEVVGDVAIAPPLATIVYAGNLLFEDYLWTNVAATLTALVWSVGLSWAFGVLIGVVLGFHRFSGEVAEPIITSLYTIPKVTLYPLVLLVFGLGLPAKIAFGVMHGIIPVVIFTMGAIRAIRPVHLKTARVLDLTPAQTARTILMPAVTPEIFTGLRVGFSLCMLGVIVGEMFASQRGVGYMVMNAMHVYDVKALTASIFLLVVFAVVSNTALLAVDRRLRRGSLS